MSETIEPWVDAAAVAAHLGFTEDHIRKQATAGNIPGVQMKNGKRAFWRFKISMVEESMQRSVTGVIREAMPLMSALVHTLGS